ncbi:MAG: hypothetical protein E7497_00080 [Ruminococcus sp.]|nr:hypothetical protein [Ruminococcus sp.]
MDNLKEIIRAVCIISAAICIMDGLVSGTRLKNQMKFLLNLIFITVIVTPFLKGTLKFELPDLKNYTLPEYTKQDELYNEEIRIQTGENISSVLLQQLEAAGVECSKIETNVNISETNSIYISNVTVSADDFQAAAQVIRNSLGEETEVIDGNR